jgi:hypothetical protein
MFDQLSVIVINMFNQLQKPQKLIYIIKIDEYFCGRSRIKNSKTLNSVTFEFASFKIKWLPVMVPAVFTNPI